MLVQAVRCASGIHLELMVDQPLLCRGSQTGRTQPVAAALAGGGAYVVAAGCAAVSGICFQSHLLIDA